MSERELTEAEKQLIATLMRERREYTLKALARRWQVSVNTLYRIERRVAKYLPTPTNPKPE